MLFQPPSHPSPRAVQGLLVLGLKIYLPTFTLELQQTTARNRSKETLAAKFYLDFFTSSSTFSVL